VHVSSLVALVGGENRGKTLTADSPLGKTVGPYQHTKRDSDAYARELQAKGLPVVITYPGSVWGPFDPYLGESAQWAQEMVRGHMPFTSTCGVGIVDVRDLALLHARLLKRHDGPKRYPAFGHRAPFAELHSLVCHEGGVRRANIVLPDCMMMLNMPFFIWAELLGLRLPAGTSDGVWLLLCNQQVDNSVSERELGVTFRPLTESVRDTVAWLKAEGQLPARPPLPLLSAGR
jgi:nucleoside-diphosphate-sugar epimerase